MKELRLDTCKITVFFPVYRKRDVFIFWWTGDIIIFGEAAYPLGFSLQPVLFWPPSLVLRPCCFAHFCFWVQLALVPRWHLWFVSDLFASSLDCFVSKGRVWSWLRASSVFVSSGTLRVFAWLVCFLRGTKQGPCLEACGAGWFLDPDEVSSVFSLLCTSPCVCTIVSCQHYHQKRALLLTRSPRAVWPQSDNGTAPRLLPACWRGLQNANVIGHGLLLLLVLLCYFRMTETDQARRTKHAGAFFAVLLHFGCFRIFAGCLHFFGSIFCGCFFLHFFGLNPCTLFLPKKAFSRRRRCRRNFLNPLKAVLNEGILPDPFFCL